MVLVLLLRKHQVTPLAPSFGQGPAWADGKTEGHGFRPTKEHFYLFSPVF